MPGCRCALYLILLTSLSSCEIKVKKKVTFAKPTALVDSIPESDTSVFLSLKKVHAISFLDLLSQHWELEDADKQHWNEFFWDSLRDKRLYTSLYLFSDSGFIENPRGKMALGKWFLNKENRELVLLYPGKQLKEYFIKSYTPSKLVTSWERDGQLIRFEFSADNLVYRKLIDDPFHPSNNQWRVRPDSSESSEQIRQRIKDCVGFYALYFGDNRRRKERTISFEGLPNCFVWYNGGIALQQAYELDKKWINCFYSEQQAMQAYDMVKGVLDKHQLKWPAHAGGWIEELQSILSQIHDQL